MRVLVIKTSSLGDVIHTLPALTDAADAYPDIQFDWVVEENFAEVPTWHRQVNEVIPVALRRWRKNIRQSLQSEEWRYFVKRLRSSQYDKIIDAQGLIKSALLTRLAKGERNGLAWGSLREPLASLAYQRTFSVAKQQHAIIRVRELFAKVLAYDLPISPPNGGIAKERLPAYTDATDYIVFLHGTTWANKHWPEEYWQQLAKLVTQASQQILLPWGNQAERERAERIAQLSSQIKVLAKMSLTQLAGVLAGAKAVVSVDTGLSHLAAALAVPTIGIYGPTNPALTGSFGPGQIHLSADFPCAPCLKRQCQYQQPSQVWPACFTTINPAYVWQQLKTVLAI
jgi:heptosyltransferase-1